ncbi:nuclease-related domain protein, partial [Vibrio cholerae HC-17A1]
GKSNT